jgi:1,4-alpha-glucan branching enzyme
MVTTHKDGTVEFAFFRPAASSVRLVGDFNGWRPNSYDLKANGKGWWTIRLALPAGEYRFKYLVDNKVYEADFAAYGVEPDKMGGWNSVLYINRAVQTGNVAQAA